MVAVLVPGHFGLECVRVVSPHSGPNFMEAFSSSFCAKLCESVIFFMLSQML